MICYVRLFLNIIAVFLRFISVTDRFLAELGPVAMGQVSKDQGAMYENLVKGLTHIKIKVILFMILNQTMPDILFVQGLASRGL